jgi:hypothetical protein
MRDLVMLVICIAMMRYRPQDVLSCWLVALTGRRRSVTAPCTLLLPCRRFPESPP